MSRNLLPMAPFAAFAVLGALCLLLPEDAFAASVGLEAQRENWINQLQTVTGLITTLSVVIGLGFTAVGVMALIRYSKDQRQNNDDLKKGAGLVLLGPILMMLPLVVDLSTETISGAEVDASNADNIIKKAMRGGDKNPLDRY